MRQNIFGLSMFSLMSIVIAAQSTAPAQPSKPDLRRDFGLRAESGGWDAVLNGLLSAFDQADALVLGEAHTRKVDSDLRIRLIRHPSFPKKARFIVMETGNLQYQSVLDRYVNGDDVQAPELLLIRGPGVYGDMVEAVRDVNRNLEPAARLRVLAAGKAGANPGERNDVAMSVIREQVLQKGEKALVIFGAGHVWHGEGGLTRRLQEAIPGRVFVAETLAPVSNGRTGPEYDELDKVLQSLERTLSSSERPVLVSMRGTPAAKLIANPFYLGQGMLPADTTLGDLDDAIVYFGRTPEVGTLVRPAGGRE
jgi:hypothetical protein